MKRSLTFFFSAAVIGLLAFMPKQDDPVEKLVEALQKWTYNNPVEKVYLHTDKPYYLVGDTIWLKAYVTIGAKHQLSARSGAVYVDLINEGDSIAQSIKLPLTAGMAAGDFVLPDSIFREGNYRIRAYTQWMRNAGPDYFYDRTFSIGNSLTNNVFSKVDYSYTKNGQQTKTAAILTYTDENGEPYKNKTVEYDLRETFNSIVTGKGKTNEKGELIVNLPDKKDKIHNSYLLTKILLDGDQKVAKTFPLIAASARTDIQFFPEGGNLVEGLKSRVAFKATGNNGLGVAVSGTITDNTGNEVAAFQSKHLGMGAFALTPEAGKTYQAKVTFPDGSVNTIKMPRAQSEGYVLSVYNLAPADSVLVKVQASPSILKKENQKISLVAQLGGAPQYTGSLEVNKASTSLYLPVKDIPSGILQFTLFNDAAIPISERVIFVEGKDQMQLTIAGAGKEFKRREYVDLDLEAKDQENNPFVGSFSMSVISEDAVPSDETNENSIFSQLLLSSDIRGYIEKPNYYFQDPSKQTRDDLDLLMLTQGYRRFAWQDFTSGKPLPKAVFKPEKQTTDVTGKLVSLSNKPVPGGRVMLFSNKFGLVRDTVTDQNGLFRFTGLYFKKGLEFSVQGRTAKNGKKVEVLVDKIPPANPVPNKNTGDINNNIPKLVRTMLDNSIKQDDDLQKHGKMGRIQLREVRIKASRKPTSGSAINENQADQVFKPDLRRPCKTLMECLIEMDNNKSVRFEFENGDWVPYTKSKELYAITIDGILITDLGSNLVNFQQLLQLSPSVIDKVYFSYDSPAISSRLLGGHFDGLRPPPVMALYTKKGIASTLYNPSMAYYDPIGFDVAREFYTPVYDNAGHDNPVADLRSTVYWNPSILTGTDGKVKIGYYNSDNTGSYRVIIEGINSAGMLGRKVFRYKVK